MATHGVGDSPTFSGEGPALNPNPMGSGSSSASAASPATNQGVPRVILFLHTLAISVEDDFPGTVPLMPNRMDQLAAAYELPLQGIFSSPLNYAGRIQTVYVHFGRRGIFEMNPRAAVFRYLTPHRFQNALMELFQNDQLLELASHEVAARRLQDINTVLAALPNNCRKVGCLSGSTSLEASQFWNFVNGIEEDQTLFLVIGNFSNSQLEQHLEEFVKVSNFDLEAATCVMRMVDAVGQKWNIY